MICVAGRKGNCLLLCGEALSCFKEAWGLLSLDGFSIQRPLGLRRRSGIQRSEAHRGQAKGCSCRAPDRVEHGGGVVPRNARVEGRKSSGKPGGLREVGMAKARLLPVAT